MSVTPETLLAEARKARALAYAPYSGFPVGAALLTEDGTLFTGCNIESKSYGATVCAERTALFSAVAAGHRRFQALAVVGYPEGGAADTCFPCGICRETLSEFCKPDFTVILETPEGTPVAYSLEDLLPHAFLLPETEVQP